MVFPSRPSNAGDVNGWIYFDLSNQGSPAYSASRGGFAQLNGARQSQGWVTAVHSWAKGYTMTTAATMLANGCTPGPPVTAVSVPIAPGPNVTP